MVDKLLIGRNEWCQLPDLQIPVIKAKIDTGAKTSAIHAFNIRPVTENQQTWVLFDIYPLQGNTNPRLTCRAPVVDVRAIMSSNGHKEHRYIVKTNLQLADKVWQVELSLSNRDPLRFRLLLGREALKNFVLIDPNLSCHLGDFKKSELSALYSID